MIKTILNIESKVALIGYDSLRYCFKNTINYNAFLSDLIRYKGAFIRRELPTKDEPVICILSYNDFWSEFRYTVDGAPYAMHRDFNYVLREFEGLFPLL